MVSNTECWEGNCDYDQQGKTKNSNLGNPAVIDLQTWLQTRFLQALDRNDVLLKSGHGDISKCASKHVSSGLKPHESVTHELRITHLTVKYGRL